MFIAIFHLFHNAMVFYVPNAHQLYEMKFQAKMDSRSIVIGELYYLKDFESIFNLPLTMEIKWVRTS